MRERFGVSQRGACRVVGQHRSTEWLSPPVAGEQERQLRQLLVAFSRERPGWGWRRAAKAARRAGWVVNDERVRRLWREEGLRVPERRRTKRLTGPRRRSARSARSNRMWCGPWIPGSTPTADGRTLKLLNVIDEFTRECPVILVDRRIDADAVVAVLDRLALERGVPGYVRDRKSVV